jgi:hypothetical protein
MAASRSSGSREGQSTARHRDPRRARRRESDNLIVARERMFLGSIFIETWPALSARPQVLIRGDRPPYVLPTGDTVCTFQPVRVRVLHGAVPAGRVAKRHALCSALRFIGDANWLLHVQRAALSLLSVRERRAWQSPGPDDALDSGTPARVARSSLVAIAVRGRARWFPMQVTRRREREEGHVDVTGMHLLRLGDGLARRRRDARHRRPRPIAGWTHLPTLHGLAEGRASPPSHSGYRAGARAASGIA